MPGPYVQTAIVTSDTKVSDGPATVYWVFAWAGATGGAFQLNDSTDDSGTDLMSFNVEATSTIPPHVISMSPVKFPNGLFVDIPGTNVTVTVGYSD